MTHAMTLVAADAVMAFVHPSVIADALLALGIVTFGVLLIRELVGLCSALWMSLREALAEDHPRPVWRLRRRARRANDLTQPRPSRRDKQPQAASSPADAVRTSADPSRAQRPKDDRITRTSRNLERDQTAIVVPKRVE